MALGHIARAGDAGGTRVRVHAHAPVRCVQRTWRDSPALAGLGDEPRASGGVDILEPLWLMAAGWLVIDTSTPNCGALVQ